MNIANPATTIPWYREPWPWLLMAGPAIVVVAGFVTLGFAIESSDGLVADDYYKQGKAINMMLTRDANAKALGYRAQLAMTAAGQLTLRFAEAAPISRTLRLTLHHPTRAGFDRQVQLARTADGSYTAAMPAIDASRWSLTLDDEANTWRLTGDWHAGEKSVALGAKALPH